MTITRETEFNQVYVDNKGSIKVVDFTWVFSDGEYPGVTSSHGAVLDISGSNLNHQTSTAEDINEAIDIHVGEVQTDQIIEWHKTNIQYSYNMKNLEASIHKILTAEDVVEERNRRLALGFNYTFNDSRGTHHIATSDEDLKNWDEVTKLSTAAILAGVPETEIAIKTETAPVTVTAVEWQQILIAAGLHRQPLFQASFALQDMNPIPSDYKDDAHWA